MQCGQHSGKVVIGLGSGRSGTASLASLIDRQLGGLCFHEMNPSCAVFSGNPQPHLNTVKEFQAIVSGGSRALLSIDYSRPASIETYEKLQHLPEVKVLGDIASYYLSYVENILEIMPYCVFVCIKRDREKTISSWMRKSMVQRWPSLTIADRLKAVITRSKFQTEFNYWQEHDGTVWMRDSVWDKCFPKFNASSKEEAIGMYWDYYYSEASRLEEEHPGSFRVFDINDLSSRPGQQRILSFIGIPEVEMICDQSAHLHKSS